MALDIAIGDSLVWDLTLEYVGPAYNKDIIRLAIGQRILGVFDEIVYQETPVSMPATPVWTKYGIRLLMEITDDLNEGDTYDIYAKMRKAPGGINIWSLDNAIKILQTSLSRFRNLDGSISRRKKT